MVSNMKLAAEKLFEIADALEKEAAENTFFVCEGCNHTSSLADINAKRKIAGETYKVKRVASVSVNDVVSCPACGDKMSYVPTDMSEKYYVEAEDIGADIFEPVDERGKDEPSEESKPEGEITIEIDKTSPEVEDSAPETSDTPELDKAPEKELPETDAPETPDVMDYDSNPEDETSTEDISKVPENLDLEKDEVIPSETTHEDETSTEGVPEESIEDDTSDEEPVVEETVPEDSTSETVSEGDTSDEPVEEKGVELPKKNVPKFEKIPKDASADFMRAVAKYSF